VTANLRCSEGATAVEYALVAAAIAAVIIAVVAAVGGQTAEMLDRPTREWEAAE